MRVVEEATVMARCHYVTKSAAMTVINCCYCYVTRYADVRDGRFYIMIEEAIAILLRYMLCMPDMIVATLLIRDEQRRAFIRWSDTPAI